MRRKRELSFRKKTTIVDFQIAENFWESTYSYECLNSLVIALFVLQKAGFSNLVDWEFNDYGTSRILLKCTKEEFEKFVKEFIKEFENDIEDIKF